MSLVNAKNFHPDVDVNNGVFQADQIEVVGRSSAPTADLSNGRIYYNSTDNKLYGRVNGSWVDLGASGVSSTLSGLTDTTISSPASGHILIYDGTDSWDNKAVSGDITISNAGVVAIASGVIVNADISASADIAVSKLALTTGSMILGASSVGSALDVSTDGGIIIGNGTTAAVQTISGDASLSNAGVVSVSDLTISGEVEGNILYFDGTNWVRLANGSSGQFLKTQGAAAPPIWDTPSIGSTDKLVSPFTIEGGTYDPSTTVTTQTSAAAALTIPDLAGVAQEWVFSKKAQTLENKTLTAPKIVTGGYIADAGGDEYLKFVEATTPVSYIQITSGDTGVAPEIASAGETNLDLALVAAGTGVVKADGIEVATISGTQTLTNKTLTAPKFADGGFLADANGNEVIVLGTTASAVNELKVTNAATGNGVTVASQGETNVDLLLVAAGTGVVKADGVEVVTLSGTQTLTNKTLTTPTLTTPTVNGIIGAYTTKSADYTLTASDYCVDVTGASANVTITLPTASGIAGTIYVIKRSDATYDVVIDGNGAETIDGSATITLTAQYQFKMVQSDGTNWIVIASG